MNRSPFNRTGFNQSGQAENTGNSGLALLKLSTSPIFMNRDIKIVSTASSMELKTEAVANTTKRVSGTAIMKLTTSGEQTKTIFADLSTAVMVLSASAKHTSFGESVITLTGLTLKPGDKLVINTCDMTVTLNGHNGMRYFSSDSEFFKLLSGANEIVYSDGSDSRSINIDVIWKDRWL